MLSSSYVVHKACSVVHWDAFHYHFFLSDYAFKHFSKSVPYTLKCYYALIWQKSLQFEAVSGSSRQPLIFSFSLINVKGLTAPNLCFPQGRLLIPIMCFYTNLEGLCKHTLLGITSALLCATFCLLPMFESPYDPPGPLLHPHCWLCAWRYKCRPAPEQQNTKWSIKNT